VCQDGVIGLFTWIIRLRAPPSVLLLHLGRNPSGRGKVVKHSDKTSDVIN
jgi:hypothetical protein